MNGFPDKPIKLTPALKDYIWGGMRLKDLYGRDNGGNRIAESWELSVHENGMSETEFGRLGDLLDAHPEAVFPEGGKLPVLIKYIDALDKLSVQVHPSDEFAREHEGDNGKTEMWYIMGAKEGAGIYCGFKRNTCREEFMKAVQDCTVAELLNFIPVKAGDCFLIPAGTVHAIGAGCLICEVQQNSNVTYRVYDYDRRDSKGNARELHVDKAAQVINFSEFGDCTNSGEYASIAGGGRIRKLTECEYFKCRELELNGKFEETAGNSFRAVNVLEGSGKISGENFASGDSFFVPCGKTYALEGKCKAIITEGAENK